MHPPFYTYSFFKLKKVTNLLVFTYFLPPAIDPVLLTIYTSRRKYTILY